jgi:hypothetical protein
LGGELRDAVGRLTGALERLVDRRDRPALDPAGGLRESPAWKECDEPRDQGRDDDGTKPVTHNTSVFSNSDASCGDEK